jgi:hypothetical protein
LDEGGLEAADRGKGDVGRELSELNDWDLDSMGTVKLLRFLSGGCDSGVGLGIGLYSSSGGISSAAGIGMPLTAATIWCSTQDSLKSFRPFQKGAIFRSIYSK